MAHCGAVTYGMVKEAIMAQEGILEYLQENAAWFLLWATVDWPRESGLTPSNVTKLVRLYKNRRADFQCRCSRVPKVLAPLPIAIPKFHS